MSQFCLWFSSRHETRTQRTQIVLFVITSVKLLNISYAVLYQTSLLMTQIWLCHKVANDAWSNLEKQTLIRANQRWNRRSQLPIFLSLSLSWSITIMRKGAPSQLLHPFNHQAADEAFLLYFQSWVERADKQTGRLDPFSCPSLHNAIPDPTWRGEEAGLWRGSGEGVERVRLQGCGRGYREEVGWGRWVPRKMLENEWWWEEDNVRKEWYTDVWKMKRWGENERKVVGVYDGMECEDRGKRLMRREQWEREV